MEINLRQFFTPAAVASSLKTLPELQTFIIDRIYTQKINHPMPVLGADDLADVCGNVPVIRRGTAAHPLTAGAKSLSYIEPQPVELSSFLSATELNNLKLLSTEGVQSWVNQKIDQQRRAVRATAEALACQSLTGTISYPMRTAAGLDTYTVEFGSPLAYTPGTTWDASGASVGKVLKDLIGMANQIKRTSGYGSKVRYLAGEDVFVALADLVVSNKTNISAEVNEKGISLAGFTVELAQGGYTNLNTSAWTPAVTAKNLIAIAVDAPFKLFYCAIDDVDAGLVPMPFFSQAVKTTDPSGYKIIGKSKPLPVPPVKAICSAQVVA